VDQEDLSPEDFESLARIAHRYYLNGRTQEEIGREFGLSRPKVQRLLDRARSSGVVDIRIASPPWVSLDLETRLCDEFRLSDSIVAPRRADPQSQREAVARSAAQFLERRLIDGAGRGAPPRGGGGGAPPPPPPPRRGAAILPSPATAGLRVRERNGWLAAGRPTNQPE
jgi:hypothetical protein